MILPLHDKRRSRVAEDCVVCRGVFFPKGSDFTVMTLLFGTKSFTHICVAIFYSPDIQVQPGTLVPGILRSLPSVPPSLPPCTERPGSVSAFRRRPSSPSQVDQRCGLSSHPNLKSGVCLDVTPEASEQQHQDVVNDDTYTNPYTVEEVFHRN